MQVSRPRDQAFAQLFRTQRFEAFAVEAEDASVPAIEIRRYTAKAVRSAPECDIWVTSGMSDVAMEDDQGQPLRRELIFYAPLGGNYVTGFGALATFPFEERTYLDRGHTVQVFGSFFVPDGARTLTERGVEAVTLPHVFLSEPLLTRHRKLGEELAIDGVPVEFLWTIPISAAELAFKKAKGTGALLDLFDQRELPWLFEPHRTSYLR